MGNNYKKVNLVLWVILFANMGVALLKIFVGAVSGSASITADGFHSLSDGTSNIAGIIGVKLASKPKDKSHPYGHGKFEILTGLFIGAVLLYVGGEISINAIKGFINPVAPTFTTSSFLLMLFTLVVNIFVFSYEYIIGKKLNSHILISDALHTKSDIFVSSGVILTLMGIKFGLPPVFDSIVSLIVACFIFRSAFSIAISSVDVLVDKAMVDDEKVIAVLKQFPDVIGCHNIRSRGHANHMHIDMHVKVNPDMSVLDSHKLSHKIADKIREEINYNTEVIIHIEPYLGGDKIV